jgi:mono/diheme cytochrome c family protein
MTLLVLGLATSPLAAQEAVPDSATIARGKAIFEGRGLCATCHGSKGEGILGPTLRLDAGKREWLHSDGTLAGIIAVIKSGIDGDKSKSGHVMPPLGGARLNDQQVAQVAAYVQALHRRPLEGS